MIRKLADIAGVITWGAFAFLVAAVTLAVLGTGIGARIFALLVAVPLILAEPDGFAGLVRRLRRREVPDA